jgi:hypothetical protein
VDIRQKINENPAATTAVTALIVVLAILFIFWQACSGPSTGAVSTKAYYTTDNGKTYFPDESSNIPPYLKDGKEAVRAVVMTCDGGKTKFVGYLERYAPQDKMVLEQMAKASQAKSGPPPFMGYPGQPMVKRPGEPDNAWVPLSPATSTYYQTIVQPKCPGGQSQENLTKVFPGD